MSTIQLPLHLSGPPYQESIVDAQGRIVGKDLLVAIVNQLPETIRVLERCKGSLDPNHVHTVEDDEHDVAALLGALQALAARASA